MVEALQEDSDVRSRLESVRRRIESGARACGRPAEDVTLVAVTKTHASSVVREAFDAGARDFGENRVQEAEGKIEELHAATPNARWHLIGRLQSNKARRAVKLFDVVHSVDSSELVRRLERLCAEEERESLDALAQVDLAGERTKSGADEAELERIVEAFGECGRLKFRGLMILPPFFEDAERVRPYFRRLRELRDSLGERGAFGEGRGELSMGMTHDFGIAIEEGATIVRVGTAIFGERDAARKL